MPVIQGLAGVTDMPTNGTGVVSVFGVMFGPSASLGNVVVAVCYDTRLPRLLFTAHCDVSPPDPVGLNQTLTCTGGVGFGSDINWYVIVGNQSSVTVFGQSNYAVPTVTGISPVSNATSVTALETVGGEVLLLSGHDFGPVVPENNATVRLRSAYTTYATSNCTLVDAHVGLQCVVPPGAGALYQWAVFVGFIWGPWSTVTTTYAIPVIVSVSTVNVITDGGVNVLVTGA